MYIPEEFVLAEELIFPIANAAFVPDAEYGVPEASRTSNL